jgi:hypothetical protein
MQKNRKIRLLASLMRIQGSKEKKEENKKIKIPFLCDFELPLEK